MYVCDDGGGDGDNKDQSSPIKPATFLELRLPVEYAAVIQGVFQDLCIMGNSISHNITVPTQCVARRVIMRPDHVCDGTIVLSFIQLWLLFLCIIRAKADFLTSTASSGLLHSCHSLLGWLSAGPSKIRQLRAISLLNLFLISGYTYR